MAKRAISGSKQSAAEMMRIIQQLKDETLISRWEDGARGVLEDPHDSRHEAARRLLELRPAIRRRADIGLLYNDLMTEFRDLCDSIKIKHHKIRSVPQKRRGSKEWAEMLAEQINCWTDIPGHNNPIEIEDFAVSYKIYLGRTKPPLNPGESVVCRIADGDGERSEELVKSSFMRRYFYVR